MQETTSKCCGTCKHSVFIDSDFEWMKCRFPVIPAAYRHGQIHSSDGCNFAGTHKTSGKDCQCYELHDCTPDSSGNWLVMTQNRTVGQKITESKPREVTRFTSERAALIHRDKMRASEPSKWNDKGVPFTVFFIREIPTHQQQSDSVPTLADSEG